jgi:hypothetical protein
MLTARWKENVVAGDQRPTADPRRGYSFWEPLQDRKSL